MTKADSRDSFCSLDHEVLSLETNPSVTQLLGSSNSFGKGPCPGLDNDTDLSEEELLPGPVIAIETGLPGAQKRAVDVCPETEQPGACLGGAVSSAETEESDGHNLQHGPHLRTGEIDAGTESSSSMETEESVGQRRCSGLTLETEDSAAERRASNFTLETEFSKEDSLESDASSSFQERASLLREKNLPSSARASGGSRKPDVSCHESTVSIETEQSDNDWIECSDNYGTEVSTDLWQDSCLSQLTIESSLLRAASANQREVKDAKRRESGKSLNLEDLLTANYESNISDDAGKPSCRKSGLSHTVGTEESALPIIGSDSTIETDISPTQGHQSTFSVETEKSADIDTHYVRKKEELDTPLDISVDTFKAGQSFNNRRNNPQHPPTDHLECGSIDSLETEQSERQRTSSSNSLATEQSNSSDSLVSEESNSDISPSYIIDTEQSSSSNDAENYRQNSPASLMTEQSETKLRKLSSSLTTEESKPMDLEQPPDRGRGSLLSAGKEKHELSSLDEEPVFQRRISASTIETEQSVGFGSLATEGSESVRLSSKMDDANKTDGERTTLNHPTVIEASVVPEQRSSTSLVTEQSGNKLRDSNSLTTEETDEVLRISFNTLSSEQSNPVSRELSTSLMIDGGEHFTTESVDTPETENLTVVLHESSLSKVEEGAKHQRRISSSTIDTEQSLGVRFMDTEELFSRRRSNSSIETEQSWDLNSLQTEESTKHRRGSMNTVESEQSSSRRLRPMLSTVTEESDYHRQGSSRSLMAEKTENDLRDSDCSIVRDETNDILKSSFNTLSTEQSISQFLDSAYSSEADDYENIRSNSDNTIETEKSTTMSRDTALPTHAAESGSSRRASINLITTGLSSETRLETNPSEVELKPIGIFENSPNILEMEESTNQKKGTATSPMTDDFESTRTGSLTTFTTEQSLGQWHKSYLSPMAGESEQPKRVRFSIVVSDLAADKRRGSSSLTTLESIGNFWESTGTLEAEMPEDLFQRSFSFLDMDQPPDHKAGSVVSLVTEDSGSTRRGSMNGHAGEQQLYRSNLSTVTEEAERPRKVTFNLASDDKSNRRRESYRSLATLESDGNFWESIGTIETEVSLSQAHSYMTDFEIDQHEDFKNGVTHLSSAEELPNSRMESVSTLATEQSSGQPYDPDLDINGEYEKPKKVRFSILVTELCSGQRKGSIRSLSASDPNSFLWNSVNTIDTELSEFHSSGSFHTFSKGTSEGIGSGSLMTPTKVQPLAQSHNSDLGVVLEDSECSRRESCDSISTAPKRPAEPRHETIPSLRASGSSSGSAKSAEFLETKSPGGPEQKTINTQKKDQPMHQSSGSVHRPKIKCDEPGREKNTSNYKEQTPDHRHEPNVSVPTEESETLRRSSFNILPTGQSLERRLHLRRSLDANELEGFFKNSAIALEIEQSEDEQSQSSISITKKSADIKKESNLSHITQDLDLARKDLVDILAVPSPSGQPNNLSAGKDEKPLPEISPTEVISSQSHLLKTYVLESKQSAEMPAVGQTEVEASSAESSAEHHKWKTFGRADEEMELTRCTESRKDKGQNFEGARQKSLSEESIGERSPTQPSNHIPVSDESKTGTRCALADLGLDDQEHKARPEIKSERFSNAVQKLDRITPQLKNQVISEPVTLHYTTEDGQSSQRRGSVIDLKTEGLKYPPGLSSKGLGTDSRPSQNLKTSDHNTSHPRDISLEPKEPVNQNLGSAASSDKGYPSSLDQNSVSSNQMNFSSQRRDSMCTTESGDECQESSSTIATDLSDDFRQRTSSRFTNGPMGALW